ncbi:MAG: SUMF1/EgtB/PvdO family nonheme iron enzyme [Spirochaetaceae bacterium]|nr:SUMF1/EgtB/PvdO family nonheme iron enzyme [Spirochaetaceae bacterium]
MIKTKQPNELGLYDMSGNVWELCWSGASLGSNRIICGGSWGNSASGCRVDFGNCYYPPDQTDYYIGFRVVRSAN